MSSKNVTSDDNSDSIITDGTLSSLKSEDLANINNLLNEGKSPSKENSQPWWLNSSNKTEESHKKPTWLKKQGTSVKDDSKALPVKKTSEAVRSMENKTPEIKSSFVDSKNVGLQSKSTKVDQLKSLSISEDDSSVNDPSSITDYSQDFEQENSSGELISKEESVLSSSSETESLSPMQKSSKETSADNSNLNKSSSAQEIESPSRKPDTTFTNTSNLGSKSKSSKGKHVTFTNKDEYVEPAEYSTSSDSQSSFSKIQKSNASELRPIRIAANFDNISPKSVEENETKKQSVVKTEELIAASNKVDIPIEDTPEFKKALADCLSVKEAEFKLRLEQEHKYHLSEISKLQEQSQAIHKEVISQNQSSEGIDILKMLLNKVSDEKTTLERSVEHLGSLKKQEEDILKVIKATHATLQEKNYPINVSKSMKPLTNLLSDFEKLLNKHSSQLAQNDSKKQVGNNSNDHLQFLKNKVLRLENELAKKDDQSREAITNLRKEYNNMKKHYNHHKGLLQAQVTNLKQGQNIPAEPRSVDTSPSKMTITSLSRDCSIKDREINLLKERVNELEKQRLAMSPKREKPSCRREEEWKSRITILEKEKASFLMKIKTLEIENKELKSKIIKFKDELANKDTINQTRILAVESQLHERIKELEDEMSCMKNEQGLKLKEMKSEYAMRHSVSQLAKLEAQIETQSITLNHYQNIIKKDKELKNRFLNMENDFKELKKKNVQLRIELDDAKSNHTPKRQQFEELRFKIHELTANYKEREEQMAKFISNTGQKIERDEIVAMWKQRYGNKHNQIIKFREELDELLEILKELQRQGIRLPKKNIEISR